MSEVDILMAELDKITRSKKFSSLYEKMNESDKFKDIPEFEKKLALAVLMFNKKDLTKSLKEYVEKNKEEN